ANGTTPGAGYDQLRVIGTVVVNGATLHVVFGFPVLPDASFLFINNDGTDAIAGNFTGLAEGAVISLNGACFQISYQGGSGNDLELTALGRNRLFVTGLAVDLLGRFPGPAELTFWVGELNAGR